MTVEQAQNRHSHEYGRPHAPADPGIGEDPIDEQVGEHVGSALSERANLVDCAEPESHVGEPSVGTDRLLGGQVSREPRHSVAGGLEVHRT